MTLLTTVDFKIGNGVVYYINKHSFPIFFGQMASAYEGAGLVGKQILNNSN